MPAALSAPTDLRKRRRLDSSIFVSPDAFDNDARVALESPVRPGPIDHHREAVSKSDEEIDVRPEPDEPGREAREVHAPELGDRGFSADRGELAVVAVTERNSRFAFQRIENIQRGNSSHL